MSAGSFQRGRYEDDQGIIHRIRIQPETLMGAFNAVPAGALSPGVASAKMSLTRRSLGLRPRFITISFTGTVPDGYKTGGLLRVPILSKAVFDGITLDQTVTYLGQPAIVISKDSERVK